jgi:hypothetical protein
VFRSGPADELTNSTNRSSLVPIIEYGNLPIPQNMPVISWKEKVVFQITLSCEGPRSRCYGRTAALRRIVQHCDEDD